MRHALPSGLLCLLLASACGPAVPTSGSEVSSSPPPPVASSPAVPSPSARAALPACEDVAPMPDVEVPTDDAALAELHERQMQADVGGLRQWAQRDHPDRFGGIWFDHEADVGTTIAFTGTDVADLQAEAERFGPVRVVGGARASLRDLLAAQERLTALPPALDGMVVASGIDEMNQYLTIHLLEPDQAVRDRLAGEFHGLACVTISQRPTVADAEVVRWELAPDAPASGDVTHIDVLLREDACASGQAATGRVAPPEVRYGAEAVVVTVRVIPVAGGAECPSNPLTPFTVVLDEPLGDRHLLDGGVDPAAPPSLAATPR